MTINPATRGRPRSTGEQACSRCARQVTKTYRLGTDRCCGICYRAALHQRGRCTACSRARLVPGRDAAGNQLCVDCAGIPRDFHCTSCGTETYLLRARHCARCVLHADLQILLAPAIRTDHRVQLLAGVLEASDRPESILTWMRAGTAARALLGSIADGSTELTHESLDQHGTARHAAHIRQLAEHHGILEPRDRYLGYFQHWIQQTLAAIDDASIRQPIEQFATWHHLNRIRHLHGKRTSLQSAAHTAKQDISTSVKFLTWLRDERDRTLADCRQEDIDLWLATGNTTRSLARTFIVWAIKARLCPPLDFPHRQTREEPTISQQQRLGWIRWLLTGEHETLPYRVCGILLLLYAQPITRLVQLRTDQIKHDGEHVTIRLGIHEIPVPEPFAAMLLRHLQNRPNLQTGNHGHSIWLFPSTRAGSHLHPGTVTTRLQRLGIPLLATRNRVLRDLVAEVPAPIVADTLGYSYAAAERHVASAGSHYGHYVTRNGS